MNSHPHLVFPYLWILIKSDTKYPVKFYFIFIQIEIKWTNFSVRFTWKFIYKTGILPNTGLINSGKIKNKLSF